MGSPAGLEPATSGLAMNLHLRPESGREIGEDNSGAPPLSYRLPGRGGQWGSNPQPSGPRPDAPPVELWPPCLLGLGRRKRSAFARGSRLSPGWGITPRRPVTPAAARSIHPPPVPGFLDADRPARQDARAGRRGLAPSEAPDWLRASGAAPGTSRAAMFATESIACFLPQALLRHAQTSRPAADGIRMHLAPGAMGTRAPRDTPRLGRGRIAGEVEELGHGKLSSLSFRSRQTCARRFRKTKNRAADVLSPSAMRCSEPG